MAQKITVTPEMTAAVGKTFAVKDSENDPRRFKVAGVIESLDFGPKNGGRQPAFVVHRQDKDAEHTPPAAQFLRDHVLVPEAKAEAQA